MEAKTIDAKNIFKMVRKGCMDTNKVKGEAYFDLSASDTELTKNFIAYCKTTEDETVPESVSTAWSNIPEEWEDDTSTIPVIEKPKRADKGRAAKRSTNKTTRGEDGKCSVFGKFNASAKRCKVCEAEHAEEFNLCRAQIKSLKDKKATERAEQREAIKAQKAAEREAAKLARANMTDEEKTTERMEKRKQAYQKGNLSRYGHRLGSTAALIDDALYEGITHENLIRRILEVNPNTNEEKANIKVRDHINYLPKKRGIVVIISKADNSPNFYKTEVEEWCKDPSVEPTENTILDNRTPRPAVAGKAKEKSAE